MEENDGNLSKNDLKCTKYGATVIFQSLFMLRITYFCA
jgi:hypothetical protein